MTLTSMDFELELDRAVEKIKDINAKRVGVQVPDGLKHHSDHIQEELESRTDCQVIILAGSCYGACDLAIDMNRLGCDLLIQWGHTEWKYGSIF